MTPNKAQRTIFALMLVVTGLAIFGDVTSGKSKVVDIVPRRMVGGTIAGILLMLLAVPAPTLATGFAGLASAAALVASPGGTRLVENLRGITTADPQTRGLIPTRDISPIRQAVYDAASNPDYGIDSLTSPNPGLPPGPDMSILTDPYYRNR